MSKNTDINAKQNKNVLQTLCRCKQGKICERNKLNSINQLITVLKLDEQNGRQQQSLSVWYFDWLGSQIIYLSQGKFTIIEWKRAAYMFC